MLNEYLVHVIDEACQFHRDPDTGKSTIVVSETETGESTQVVRSDAWYLVDDKSELDAAIFAANVARIRNSDGNLIPISEAVLNSSRKQDNSSIDDFSQTVELKKTDLDFLMAGASNLTRLVCEIERSDSGSNWIEHHEIFIYVIARPKIMFVKNMQTEES